MIISSFFLCFLRSLPTLKKKRPVGGESAISLGGSTPTTMSRPPTAHSAGAMPSSWQLPRLPTVTNFSSLAKPSAISQIRYPLFPRKPRAKKVKRRHKSKKSHQHCETSRSIQESLAETDLDAFEDIYEDCEDMCEEVNGVSLSMMSMSATSASYMWYAAWCYSVAVWQTERWMNTWTFTDRHFYTTHTHTPHQTMSFLLVKQNWSISGRIISDCIWLCCHLFHNGSWYWL